LKELEETKKNLRGTSSKVTYLSEELAETKK